MGVLVVGGGVIADIGGFACALYLHRLRDRRWSFPAYVLRWLWLQEPVWCLPPAGADLDRSLVLPYPPPGMVTSWHCRDHQDGLLEEVGIRLVTDKFGVMGDETDPEFARKCDLIIAKAMEGYVRSEYGNLWETHQCRPHAFGHTWSPGYELPAGMLHGHAVATCMGYGSYLSYLKGWLTKDELDRTLKLISDMEISLWHPIMDDIELLYGSQVKIVDKRGGSLCAPVPKTLGHCGYIQHLPKEELAKTLAEYKEICSTYPRGGLGVEVHCHEVGLEDPSILAKKHVKVAADSSAPADQQLLETNAEESQITKHQNSNEDPMQELLKENAELREEIIQLKTALKLQSADPEKQ